MNEKVQESAVSHFRLRSVPTVSFKPLYKIILRVLRSGAPAEPSSLKSM